MNDNVQKVGPLPIDGFVAFGQSKQQQCVACAVPESSSDTFTSCQVSCD